MYFVLDKNGLLTCENKIIVFYRNKFNIIEKNQLGDGMEFIKILNRENFLFKNLNKNFFHYGISIFQDFDEFKGKHITYLYKFPKNDIDDFNILLESYGLKTFVKLENNFVTYENKINFEKIENYIYDAIHKKEINNIFSFIYGLIWVYGDIEIINNSINGIKINLYLRGNLLGKETLFNDIFDFLIKNGINIKFSYIKKNIGNDLQIIINDWEILEVFKNYLSTIDIYHNQKKTYLLNFEKNILNFMQKNNFVCEISDFNKKNFTTKIGNKNNLNDILK
ncbi:hypothetical protein [Candidatus Vampirococcus lugosii]|uniref:Homing endonuclease LAGLIDADG domain-containing protein n=1 Tax=Candidatus Vampirococcus lugosii TaxID=2789015 RepID=A0ABS5QKM6_9BACT|nr:hypothetical protein [Candidatus Vampirococcus lugosii]MBS8121747.1 hypothetical protein [Candidatus Vampirococcus lugosii]